MDWWNVRETAQVWGVSERSVRHYCAEGRVPGAVRHGKEWQIPADAEKPKDERVKTGRYVKSADEEEVDYKSIKKKSKD